ncbi:hypothetical protein NQ317_007312 [Molorchus minor]|uniref:Uncharacterized protein n=1 Tax=Molorchus minor TaxID=1323400 RepID=A0ABQ9J905_9CUCU|nr:hypothetical protein NQ317_007312 [Molorchus minor]
MRKASSIQELIQILNSRIPPRFDVGEKCVILAEVQFEARGLQCAEDKIASLPNAYNRFKKWCAKKNVQVYSENVLLAYFSENAKNYKSSTLWAQYSMVKSCLIIYDNIDISKFPKLIAFFEKNR